MSADRVQRVTVTLLRGKQRQNDILDSLGHHTDGKIEYQLLQALSFDGVIHGSHSDHDAGDIDSDDEDDLSRLRRIASPIR